MQAQATSSPSAEIKGTVTSTKTATPLPPPTMAVPPGTGGTAIGFVYSDSKDNWGYDQAVYAGSQSLAQEFTGRLNIVQNEYVSPQAAGQVMETMIKDGAQIIFSTALEYEASTLQLAKRYPKVAFLQLGGTKVASNVGAPGGNIWEAVYLSGVAAGKMTKNNRLGYVASFGQPQVLLDVNAFTLGVRSVNPSATVYALFTKSGCNSVKQQEAIFTLLDLGTDVVAQHQDCTRTIVEISERNAVMSVGYSVDTSAFAPKHWITGAIWNWGALDVKMVTALQAGQWNAGPYNGRYRAGLKDGLVDLAPFGSSVPQEVQTLVLERKQAIIDGTLFPFDGPIKDQGGQVRIPAGVRPSVEDLEATNYLVEGVIGTIP